MSDERRLDLICIGRAAVDLYGDQVGGRLEDMLSFSKYLGGCAANIAVGTARLGIRSAMIARVGDEAMGRFVREQLAREGVDVSHVTTDPRRLTALVVLGIRDRRHSPHIFYRTDCADMALEATDIDPAFVASAAALLVTGTHFSTPKVEEASRTAMGYARDARTRIIFDIDYRPSLWGLAGHGAGEERFIESERVTRRLQTLLPDCDLVVGTEEEINIAGGGTDTLQSVRAIRALSPDAAIVVKRGPMGCVVFDGPIPDSLEEGIRGPGFPVEVFNTLGAGDGFMSGFLRGWLRGEPLERCCAFANACGALVVSRHGCCPASPSWPELRHFLAHGSAHFRVREDEALNRLHRATTRTGQWPEVCALAFDHRRQFEEMTPDRERIGPFKLLIAEAARRAAADTGLQGAGVIVDDRYGLDVLEAVTGTGAWIARPIELPGSRPLAFEGGADVGLTLRAWPAEHVVKCLVSYHPDDEEGLRRDQEARLVQLYEACDLTRHELLLEVIPPKEPPSDDTTLARALDRIYGQGVQPDWWKLPPPSPAAWAAIAEVVGRRDPWCRGVLLLGLDAPEDELKRGFDAAAGQPLCKGFAVGRTVFGSVARDWLAGRTDDAGAVVEMAARYARLIELWRRRGR